MKKTFTIFLLLIILFNQAGFFAAFNVLMKNNFDSIRRHKNEVALISIAKKDAATVQFVNDDECIYKGRHYDVFGKQLKDGKIILSVFADEREDALFKELDDAIAQQVVSDPVNGTEKTHAKNILPLPLKEYVVQQNNFLFLTGFSKTIRQTFSQDLFSRNPPEPGSPPPQMFFS